MAKNQIDPAFEEALLGRGEGETVAVTLPPEKAYGRYRRKLVVTLKRKNSPLIAFQHQARSSKLRLMRKPCLVTVVSVTDASVTVDGNHPLAGETITYEITVMKIRSHEPLQQYSSVVRLRCRYGLACARFR